MEKQKDRRKKLTDTQVSEIRSKRKSGYSLSSLADEYGVSRQAIIYRCLSENERVVIQKKNQDNRDRVKAKKWREEWVKKNPNRLRELHQMWTIRLKEDVFSHYGGKCHCCGEDRYEFLCIDHLNNDGGTHRKMLGKGAVGNKIYRWLKANDYPKSFGIAVACFNCNMSRQYQGYCPHKKKSTENN